MKKINTYHEEIIIIMLNGEYTTSSKIHGDVNKYSVPVSLVTIKRLLSYLAQEGILHKTGGGRTTRYCITNKGRVFARIESKEYCQVKPDKRWGFYTYNLKLFSDFPDVLFNTQEQRFLEDLTTEYHQRRVGLSATIGKKI